MIEATVGLLQTMHISYGLKRGQEKYFLKTIPNAIKTEFRKIFHKDFGDNNRR